MIKACSPRFVAKIKTRWQKKHRAKNSIDLLIAIKSIITLANQRFSEDIYRRRKIKTSYFKISYRKKNI